ncbi:MULTISPECIES: hypothetical protein [unclassified Mesorhizobium]|nr:MULTISPECIES: hypothetical protein [unclassified Mesorhizobium]
MTAVTPKLGMGAFVRHADNLPFCHFEIRNVPSTAGTDALPK